MGCRAGYRFAGCKWPEFDTITGFRFLVIVFFAVSVNCGLRTTKTSRAIIQRSRVCCGYWWVPSTVSTTLLCFIPVLVHHSPTIAPTTVLAVDTNSTTIALTDDYNYFHTYEKSYLFAQGSIFPLAIMLIPGIDLLLDSMPAFIASPWYDDRWLKLKYEAPKGLSAFERFLFIVGALWTSTVLYQGDAHGAILFESFSNCATILTVGPVLSFLARRATSVHPFVSAAVAMCISVGCFCSALSYSFSSSSTEYRNLTTSATVFIISAASMFFALCLYCLVVSLRWEAVHFRGRAGKTEQGRDGAAGDMSYTTFSAAAVKEMRVDFLVIGLHMVMAMADLVPPGRA